MDLLGDLGVRGYGNGHRHEHSHPHANNQPDRVPEELTPHRDAQYTAHMPSATVCIIGAGFAGAATAYFLTRAGVRDVVILEQEAQPGAHASGNNAAMARQFVLDPEIRRLAIRGTQFLYDPPADLHPSATAPGANTPHLHQVLEETSGGNAFIRPIGSLLLFDEASEHTVRGTVEAGHRRGLTAQVIRREECEARVPVLKEADFSGAVWTPTDGVVDVHAYLHGLLSAARAHGAQLVMNRAVRAMRITKQGAEVVTDGETWRCRIVVNAAGAWADAIAALADVPPRGLTALRRHLFQSAPMREVATDWPFIWDTTHDFYFRPESGGLLCCACDEAPFPPGPARVDGQAPILLAEKLRAHCPRLANIQVATSWAGLRTFAPDRKFVLGWDPMASPFYWVAGLGGHGVTCAAAVGEQAAAEIAKRLSP